MAPEGGRRTSRDDRESVRLQTHRHDASRVKARTRRNRKGSTRRGATRRSGSVLRLQGCHGVASCPRGRCARSSRDTRGASRLWTGNGMQPVAIGRCGKGAKSTNTGQVVGYLQGWVGGVRRIRQRAHTCMRKRTNAATRHAGVDACRRPALPASCSPPRGAYQSGCSCGPSPPPAGGPVRRGHARVATRVCPRRTDTCASNGGRWGACSALP